MKNLLLLRVLRQQYNDTVLEIIDEIYTVDGMKKLACCLWKCRTHEMGIYLDKT